MATLKTDPSYGVVKYRHHVALHILYPLMLVFVVPIAVFVEETAVRVIAAVIAVMLTALYLRPLVSSAPMITTGPEGVELHVMIGRSRGAVAWQHLTGLVIWNVRVRNRKLTYLGITRVPDAPELPRERRRPRAATRYDEQLLPQGLDRRVAQAKIQVARIDPQEIAELLAKASDDAQVVDLRR